MKTRLIVLVFLFALVFSSRATYVTNYVRTNGFTSGSHSGADWNNAFNYPSITWNSAINRTNWVVFQGNQTNYLGRLFPSLPNQIIVAADGNAIQAATAGWEAGFAGPVTINASNQNNVQIDGVNNIAFNGMTRGGLTFFNVTPKSNDNAAYVVNPTANSSSIFFTNCVFKGLNTSISNSPDLGDRRGFNTGAGVYSNIVFSHCDFASLDSFIYSGNINGFVVEYCTFGVLGPNFARGLAGSPHNNWWATFGVTNCIAQYNVVSNHIVEGVMMDFVGVNDAGNEDWDIRGNLICKGYPGGVTRFLVSQWVIGKNKNIRVYNNTIQDMESFVMGVENGGSWGTGCYFSNNIVFGCGGSASDVGFRLGNDDYTLTDFTSMAGSHSIANAASSIFTDYAGNNFHIVTNIGTLFPAGKGVNMTFAGLTNDMDGVMFGTNGGSWDIGAFVAASSGNPDVTPPTIAFLTPTTGSPWGTNVANIPLTGTSSDDVGVSSVVATNISTGIKLTISGTTSWSVSSCALMVGNNNIVAWATDAAGNRNSTSLTVTYTVTPVGAPQWCCPNR